MLPLLAIVSHLPIIGWAKPVPVNPRNLRHPQRDFAIIAAAGPISNILQAIVAAILLRVVLNMSAAGHSAGSTLLDVLFLAVQVNLLLAFFNLIPVPPLDGGNVLLGVLPPALAVRYLSDPSIRLSDSLRAPPYRRGERDHHAADQRHAEDPASVKARVVSGMRPTGKLHLGHLVGALNNWARLQDTSPTVSTSSPTGTPSRATTRTPPRSWKALTTWSPTGSPRASTPSGARSSSSRSCRSTPSSSFSSR